MSEPRIVIVTGAGASRNLGAKGELPLMDDWARILIRDVDEASDGLAHAMGLHQQLSAQEFEDLIGSFLSWQAAMDLNERFRQVGGQWNEVLAWINNNRERGAAFTKALHTSLYREFGRDAIDEQAAGEAHSALRFVFPGDKSIVYATTNYNVSIEVGLKAIGINPNDGFTSAAWATPELSLDEMIDWENDHGGREPVLHLHGAVGWYRQPDGRIVQHYANLPYNPTLGTPVVLPPDPNKDPVSDSSVALIWDRFRAALREATHILVIGHSLNDAPLVNALNEALAHANLAVTFLPDRESERGAAVSRIQRRFSRKTVAIPLRFQPNLEVSSQLLDWGMRATEAK